MVESGEGKAAGKSGCVNMDKATSILTTTGFHPAAAEEYDNGQWIYSRLIFHTVDSYPGLPQSLHI